jgi:hypothetical protein
MKIKILTAAISLSLVACVTTTADQSAENILDDNYSNKSVAAAKEVKTITIAKAVAPKESLLANNDLLITLEQIMSDPDWMGRSPQSWYWGDDNQTIFYKQKRAGSPLSDLYRQATLDKEAEKVKLAQMHVVSDRNAQRN